jgi:CheY-like chemotaxis protein
LSDGRRNRQILLVEDSEAIRHAFGILLRESGYGVTEVGTGREALLAARRSPPDIVLLDLGLPDMMGLSVARELRGRAETRDIAILALTGRALESDRIACEEAGCSGYFAKPVNSADLLKALDELG